MTMTEKPVQHVRDLSPEAAAALLRDLKHGPALPPMDTSIRAADMTESQRQAFIREAARRAR
jgi:hypothetical protein